MSTTLQPVSRRSASIGSPEKRLYCKADQFVLTRHESCHRPHESGHTLANNPGLISLFTNWTPMYYATSPPERTNVLLWLTSNVCARRGRSRFIPLALAL